MSRYTIFSIIILIILAAGVVFFVTSRKTSSLVNPVLKQGQSQTWPQQSPSSSPIPSTPSFNPPKQLQYDGSTDLKKELDSVDPQVLDSDFN